MKCVKCGNELGENDVFCSICGEPVRKMNGYDRPINQQVNYGQQYVKTKNTSDVVKICIIIGVVVIILASIFIIGKNVMKDNNKTINPTPEIEDGTGTITPSPKTISNYKVVFKGFKLYIPDNLVYQMDYSNDAIIIGDSDSTWITQFLIEEIPFKKLKQNKSYLSSSMMQYIPGIVVSNTTVETIDGVEYILLNCSMSGSNAIVGLAEMNSMYSAIFVTINDNNNFDRNIIKNISTIISNAEYTGTSTYMKTNENIDIKNIYKAFDSAAAENTTED